jgi:hypothetical protein
LNILGDLQFAYFNNSNKLTSRKLLSATQLAHQEGEGARRNRRQALTEGKPGWPAGGVQAEDISSKISKRKEFLVK